MEAFLHNKNFVPLDFSNIPVRDKEDGVAHGCFMPALTNTSIEPDLGEINMRDLYLSNFSLRVTRARFNYDVDLKNDQGENHNLFGSCFFDQGVIRSYLDGYYKSVESFHGSHNFKYDPNNEFHHRAFAGMPYHIIHFSVRPEHLLNMLPQGESWSGRLQEQIVRGERMVGERYAPISLLQERVLANILHCPVQGTMGALLMEASVTQLLVLQFHALYGNHAQQRLSSLSRRDQETMHSVREYLKKRFLEDHTLDSLARQFATNTSKLMAQFKQAFGTSIFEYLSELRMEHARLLLESEGHLVCEVARTLGYKNPNHFSTAFKKHFGFNPKQIARPSTMLG